MDDTKKTKRKAYRKPAVERVKLAPEETVLGACKNPGWGGCPIPPSPGARKPGS
ncbi:MAG: hypothetical protein M0R80_07405 [Proteobacteria bacterium]|jgi:hypothetical protein|nr:hypothetical protein [Pseudomonadota bacterium]